MDIKDSLILHENIVQICNLYNHIFQNVAKIDLNEQTLSDDMRFLQPLDNSKLSNETMESLKHMSGYLSQALTLSKSLCSGQPSSSQDNMIVDREYLPRCPSCDKLTLEKMKLEEKNMKTISALQEFLIQEITRSENLDSKLRAKEAELVSMTEERNKYQKVNRNSVSQPIKVTTNGDSDIQMLINTNPNAMIDRFIRKSFGSTFYFGLIVNYDNPYFQVVYEDSDEEELTKQEVMKYLWTSSVPTSKMEQCRKHAGRSHITTSTTCISTGTTISTGVIESSMSAGKDNHPPETVEEDHISFTSNTKNDYTTTSDPNIYHSSSNGTVSDRINGSNTDASYQSKTSIHHDNLLSNILEREDNQATKKRPREFDDV